MHRVVNLHVGTDPSAQLEKYTDVHGYNGAFRMSCDNI